MKRKCPRCDSNLNLCKKNGYFIRRSDGRRILRFKCSICSKSFSQATTQLCYKQKKRKLNKRIFELLCSGVSQRRISRLLNINRKTVVRKFIYLSRIAKLQNELDLAKLIPCEEIQFDDLETIEHTKCKPLSVTMAVDKDSRQILGFAVSKMPAKGHLAKIARKKYGPRPDERAKGWEDLFLKISEKVKLAKIIRSDQNPHYQKYPEKYCPEVKHIKVKGVRGCVAGQGELKKIGFDPLFSLNHTFAMCRANINRLFRRTWCTTKRPDRLQAHLELYVNYHNRVLIRAL